MGLVTLDGGDLSSDPGQLLVEARTGSLFGEIRVDTSDAGFSKTPQYFARLNPASPKVSQLVVAYVGALAFIDRAAPDSFYFNVPLLTERNDSLTVTWLGVEPVTGCEPVPNLFFLFTLGGFLSASFLSMEVPR
jgi:hypothetical protein